MRLLRKYLAESSAESHAVNIAAVEICNYFTIDFFDDGEWVIEMTFPSMSICVDDDITINPRRQSVECLNCVAIKSSFYDFDFTCISWNTECMQVQIYAYGVVLVKWQ